VAEADEARPTPARPRDDRLAVTELVDQFRGIVQFWDPEDVLYLYASNDLEHVLDALREDVHPFAQARISLWGKARPTWQYRLRDFQDLLERNKEKFQKSLWAKMRNCHRLSAYQAETLAEAMRDAKWMDPTERSALYQLTHPEECLEQEAAVIQEEWEALRREREDAD
jgi:hypothetical protein